MTSQESNTLAALVQQVKDMATQLEKNTQDTAAIKSAVDNITGGKRALIWLAGFVVSVAMLVVTWIGLGRKL